jgi:hypothetical protein
MARHDPGEAGLEILEQRDDRIFLYGTREGDDKSNDQPYRPAKNFKISKSALILQRVL